jgi:two-component system phosphate regulon sensor histidine kinase PhoR
VSAGEDRTPAGLEGVEATGDGGGLQWQAALEGRAEAEAREPERLSALLDRLHQGVVTVSRSLRVTYANSAANDVLAAGGNRAGGMLVDPWPEPSLRDLALRMFEDGAGPAEVRIGLDANGSAYDVLALPPDASGDALLVIVDVTAHERERRAGREFVANAAHQLRTPVSAIASAIEVLQGGAKEQPATRDRFLAHLDRQCTRLVRLTRALLLLARAQALSEPPAVEIVPLNPLLVTIAGGLRPGSGVDVRVECPFDVAALSNRDMLEQAIGNLAENAAKFTQDGEIVLCAERGRDQMVCVIVRDTGPGARLGTGNFQRFYGDPDSQGEGFGLGLAIADETVRALGGELRIESDETGTRAVVTLQAATVRRP